MLREEHGFMLRAGFEAIAAVRQRMSQAEAEAHRRRCAMQCIAAHARQIPRNPLIVPEANGDELLHATLVELRRGVLLQDRQDAG